MVEGIEGGDAAGPADRLGKEWWAGRWVWCCAGCSGVGVGRRPARRHWWSKIFGGGNNVGISIMFNHRFSPALDS